MHEDWEAVFPGCASTSVIASGPSCSGRTCTHKWSRHFIPYDNFCIQLPLQPVLLQQNPKEEYGNAQSVHPT